MTQKGWGIISIIVIFGAILRFYGLDWGTDLQTGQFHAFHPDETTLIDSAALVGVDMRDIVSSYGKAPMYLLAGTARGLGYALGIVPFEADTIRFTHLTARSLSALFGTATIVLVFLIGRHLGGLCTGLLSAFFMAICAGHIQQSHYYTVETSLTFWISLSLYLALHLPTKNRWIYAAFGIAIGLATGTRLVGLYLALPFVLSHIISPDETTAIFTKEKIRNAFQRLPQIGQHILLATLIGGVVALACEPFLVLDPNLFFSDDDARRFLPSLQIAQGEIIRIWSLYDFSTTPFLFYLTHLLRDAMGYPMEIAALFGIILTIKQKNRTGLILLSWIVPYFLLIGGLHTKPIRYVTPMLPGLITLSAWACIVTGQWIRTHLSIAPTVAIPTLIIGVMSLVQGVATLQIYSREDNRIMASRWIATHMPKNAVVLTERGGFATEWMVSQNDYRVKTDQPNFFIDTEGVLPYNEQVAFANKLLTGVDWIITIEENRMRQFIHAPQQYPIGHAYYQKLQNGTLGYQPVITFQLTPFGWFTDSDPTVTAYDHPTVVIYQRTGDVTQQLAAWRDAVKQDPTLSDRELFTGISAYKKGHWEEARQAFQKSVAVRPNFLLGQALIINTYFRQGQSEHAERLWNRLIEKENGVPSEVGLGMIRAGLPQDGVLYLERQLAVYEKPEHAPDWINKAAADGWLQLGAIYDNQQNISSAQKAFERATQLAPDFAPAYVSLGTLYLSQNRVREALPILEYAVNLNLKYADTWYLLGQAHQMLGDFDKAQFYYRQAMGLSPTNARYQKAIQSLSSISEQPTNASGT